MLEEYNVWVLLAVNGFFSGFGALVAQFIWFEVVKPRLSKWHKKIKKKRFLFRK